MNDERNCNHIFWMSLAVLFITAVGLVHYQSQPVSFSTFNIISKAVPAYSRVGVSVGHPGKSYSFRGVWNAVSKLILVVAAWVGRYRCLSTSINNAVTLPSESLDWAVEDKLLKRRAPRLCNSIVLLLSLYIWFHSCHENSHLAKVVLIQRLHRF